MLGGNGFIGRQVCTRLFAAGHRVLVADRNPTMTNQDPAVVSHASIALQDLAAGDWDQLLSNVDVVHHYAWSSLPATANKDPLRDLSLNIGVTLNLLDALVRRGGGRVIFSSSGGTVYGRIMKVPISEDHELAPITGYGAGKVAAEIYLRLYRTLHRLDCRIARISNPFGAGQRVERGQGAVTTFIHKALRNEEIVIWGDGSVVRDYIHVSDVGEALYGLSTQDDLADQTTFNIGSGVGTSLNAVINKIEKALNRKIMVRHEKGRSFDVPVNVLDISRIVKTLSWSPELSLAAGIEATLLALSS